MLKTDLKHKKRISFSWFFNKVGSNFFRSVFDVAIFVFFGKYKNGCRAFLAVEIKKRMMCEKNSQ